ncbi:MAG TPA: hypothetical protein VGJ10_14390, partial [Paraburkholderia sp.]
MRFTFRIGEGVNATNSGSSRAGPRRFRNWMSTPSFAARMASRNGAGDASRVVASGRTMNSASTVRARTLHVGQRLQLELTAAPVKRPGRRTPQPHVTTVGLDGGYVRHCDPAAGHSFEIITGRLLADDGAQSSVGFVRTVDQHSRMRVQ